jgi:hypothetical protein
LVGELQPLVSRNLSRHPRRTSRVAVLIALSLAFGTFIMVFSSSIMKQAEVRIIIQTGSDVRIADDPEGASLESLGQLEGVEAVCTLERLATVSEWTIYPVDPLEYIECILENRYAPASLLDLLESLGEQHNGVIAVGSDYGRRWDRGEEISVSIVSEDRPETLRFEVLGDSGYAPGIIESMQTWSRVLIVNADYLEETAPDALLQTSAVLVKVVEGGNVTALVERIVTENQLPAYSVRSAEGDIEEYVEDPFLGAVFSYMHLEFGFTLVMATFGLGLITYVAAAERGREFAGQIARGSSRKQIVSILTGEALTILVLSFAIGVGVGLLTAFMAHAAMVRATQSVIPIPFVFPSVLLILFVLSCVSLASASFVGGLKVSRINISEILRVR